MLNDRTYSILFILNSEMSNIGDLLLQAFRVLTKRCHEIYVIYPSNLDEDFETKLKAVPWIHAFPLPLENKFNPTQAYIPMEIRRYMQKHDGVDVIHSFGLNAGVLSYISAMYLKTVIINTPNLKDIGNEKLPWFNILQKFAYDNINYVFNRLYDRILFTSKEDEEKAKDYIGFKNIPLSLLDINGTAEEIADRLIGLYSDVIDKA